MIKQLEAIKFASDWNRRSQEPGIKIFKKEFVKKTFDMDPTCCHLRQNGTYEEQAAYKKAFVAFKIKHGKTITARNYLFRLYQQVLALKSYYYYHISRHAQFGTAILLDQIWDVDKLIGSSKNFRAILNRLSTSNGEHDFEVALQHQLASERNNEQCLKSLVFLIGDQSVLDHLLHFLSHYPPRSHVEIF